MNFKDKVIILTGAAGDVGKATTEIFARQGGRLVLVDRNEQALDELVAQTHAAYVKGYPIDVSNEDQVQSVVRQTISECGTIDILVNNAGICRMIPILDIDVDEWDRFMAVNLRSVFLFSRETFRHMKERRYGKIINIGSAAGKIGGVAAGAHYAAGKAGVMCFTKSLALQAASYKINVNCVCPGPTRTAMTDAWGEKTNREFALKIPFQEYAQPCDVAEAIAFLASEQARYITGEILDVNGGLIMD